MTHDGRGFEPVRSGTQFGSPRLPFEGIKGLNGGPHLADEDLVDSLTITKDVAPRPDLVATQMGAATRPAAASHIGAHAGVFELWRVLGRGGGGTVYQGLERATGRVCAVKVLAESNDPSSVLVQRFQREIALCRELRHPNIVELYDAGWLPSGVPYFAMELLTGEDLERTLNRVVRLTPDESVRIMTAVASALHVAHERGVIHRDLKASNVFLTNEGTIKLLDFGVARVDAPHVPGLTVRGHHVGTPTNMAPEQVLCFPAEPQTDVYAAGVLLFRLLTGEYPFHGSSAEELMHAHLSAPIPRPSEVAPVPVEFDAVIHRCLQKRPEDRYETIMAMLHAVTNALPADCRVATNAPSWSVFVHSFGRFPDEDLLEAWTGHLSTLGFEPTIDTSDGTLLVKRCEPERVRAELREIVAVLRENGVWRDLRMIVHHDAARWVDGAFQGGPIAELQTWAAQVPCIPGLLFTRDAARLFE